jgi:DGQHR domain-containing protein
VTRAKSQLNRSIRVPAIEFQQGPGRALYSFAIDAKLVPTFASVSHVRRTNSANELDGYQRPEVVRHIQSIRSYLETEQAPMIPNALVVAFDSRVRFEPLENESVAGYSRHGYIVIPVGDEDDAPGFVVDGQQRSAAIREARLESFPMAVTAFITDSDEEQRKQFILVNSTKPLSKGLIHELLPTTEGHLPRTLLRKRFPALLLEHLNYDEYSPFRLRIKTATNPDGIIKDNSVLRMLESSLTEGALYRFRDPETGEGSVDQMIDLVTNFWEAVADVFPDAWGTEEPVSPRRSRLVHGCGIVSMGFVMDAITDRYYDKPAPTMGDFKADLRALAPHCRWTNGTWDFGPGQVRKWNELQNTSKDIQVLTNYLLTKYRDEVWQRAS